MFHHRTAGILDSLRPTDEVALPKGIFTRHCHEGDMWSETAKKLAEIVLALHRTDIRVYIECPVPTKFDDATYQVPSAHNPIAELNRLVSSDESEENCGPLDDLVNLFRRAVTENENTVEIVAIDLQSPGDYPEAYAAMTAEAYASHASALYLADFRLLESFTPEIVTNALFESVQQQCSDAAVSAVLRDRVVDQQLSQDFPPNPDGFSIVLVGASHATNRLPVVSGFRQLLMTLPPDLTRALPPAYHRIVVPSSADIAVIRSAEHYRRTALVRTLEKSELRDVVLGEVLAPVVEALLIKTHYAEQVGIFPRIAGYFFASRIIIGARESTREALFKGVIDRVCEALRQESIGNDSVSTVSSRFLLRWITAGFPAVPDSPRRDELGAIERHPGVATLLLEWCRAPSGDFD